MKISKKYLKKKAKKKDGKCCLIIAWQENTMITIQQPVPLRHFQHFLKWLIYNYGQKLSLKNIYIVACKTI